MSERKTDQGLFIAYGFSLRDRFWAAIDAFLNPAVFDCEDARGGGMTMASEGEVVHPRKTQLPPTAVEYLRRHIEVVAPLPEPPETFLARDFEMNQSELSSLKQSGVIERAKHALEPEREDVHAWRLTGVANRQIRELAEELEGGYPCCRFRSGFKTCRDGAPWKYECTKCGARHTREVIEAHPPGPASRGGSDE